MYVWQMTGIDLKKYLCVDLRTAKTRVSSSSSFGKEYIEDKVTSTEEENLVSESCLPIKMKGTVCCIPGERHAKRAIERERETEVSESMRVWFINGLN